MVKNVAGYDLNKLYIGAFGTLGIITEVTLKLSPIPAYEVILVADFQDVQGAVDTGLSTVGSQILPMFVNLSINSDLVSTATDNPTDTKRPMLVVGFGGDSRNRGVAIGTVSRNYGTKRRVQCHNY